MRASEEAYELRYSVRLDYEEILERRTNEEFGVSTEKLPYFGTKNFNSDLTTLLPLRIQNVSAIVVWLVHNTA